MPERETRPFPTLMQLGMRNNKWRCLDKPTPRNLHYFSHSPFAQRAINAIRNLIKCLMWKSAPRRYRAELETGEADRGSNDLRQSPDYDDSL
jgi:hypothetical protein